jgi:hypothetical protein
VSSEPATPVIVAASVGEGSTAAMLVGRHLAG